MSILIAAIVGAIPLTAVDTPNDDGSRITLQWQPNTTVQFYEIERSINSDARFDVIGTSTKNDSVFIDTCAQPGHAYYYRLRVIGTTDEISEIVGPVRAQAQIYDTSRTNIAVGIIVLFCFIIYYIIQARRGEKLSIRRIPAITAIEEAIGRATEMGKPVLYVPGIMDIDEPETIASMSILGRVAEKTAEYGTLLFVPTCHGMTMSMAQQVVKESAMRVGRPDWFNADNVPYLTDDQFGYVAAVDGIMVRQKPATNFYLGKFYAESLILAETGHSTGAIQIAGTALADQLPFFVAACDYTLLGEELYAASAYLSQEPLQLGSLKGQDMGKLIFVIIIVIGVLAELIGIRLFYDLFTIAQ